MAARRAFIASLPPSSPADAPRCCCVAFSRPSRLLIGCSPATSALAVFIVASLLRISPTDGGSAIATASTPSSKNFFEIDR